MAMTITTVMMMLMMMTTMADDGDADYGDDDAACSRACHASWGGIADTDDSNELAPRATQIKVQAF